MQNKGNLLKKSPLIFVYKHAAYKMNIVRLLVEKPYAKVLNTNYINST